MVVRYFVESYMKLEASVRLFQKPLWTFIGELPWIDICLHSGMPDAKQSGQL